MNLRDFKTVSERRKALEKELKVDLKHIGSYSLDEDIASSRNCENMVGASQVPMGVAGPLRVSHATSDKRQDKEYYIPLATTEGALVASVNRGCKAITQSGGAMVDSYRVGATRGPVFKVKNLTESDRLNTFLDTHLDDFKKITKETSHHLKLKKLMSRGVGRYRFIRFAFDSADAMGMNMATIASQALVEFIQKKTGAKCISVAGNFDSDKKPAWLNFIENRGFKAWAEVTLPSLVLEQTLKVTAAQVYETWFAKCMIGSAMSGSMGFNAQYANVVATVFLATGQDLGHVAEGSMGITTAEVVKTQNFPREDSGQAKLKSQNYNSKRKTLHQNEDESLYVSIYLPDLMVGTIGGGTGLATQKEALELLGVAGGLSVGEEGKNAQRFAQIVAASVLAGEISLLASEAEGSLARAHLALARGQGNPKF
ncbi:hydroxymethylglutaryl-CoA reductase [Candidatus Gottesmanbacteria bacterium]|nr:hydroxymethylglutaryl-CoA reductase [Candidatus Gottesmanbacteria bacterium]